jgi:CRP/FNR family transcriptional regulator, cyclic AMP receptor protein
MGDREFLGLLGDDDRAALLQAGRTRRIPARARIFEAGDPGYEVFIVGAGAVKLTRASTEGREIVISVRNAGALLGELSAIDGGVRSASATAVTEVELIVVPLTAFSTLLDTRASITRAILDVLAETIRGTTDQALEFGTVDALSRVCRRIVGFADAQAADAQPGGATNGDVLMVPLTQHEIAALSGLSREAVVKALKSMRSLGWIEVRGRQITVLDLDALRERAIG